MTILSTMAEAVADDAVRLASETLDDGWDLVLFHPDLTELLDDDDISDPEKVAERAKQLAGWKPGLAKGARVPIPHFGQGRRTPFEQGNGVNLGCGPARA